MSSIYPIGQGSGYTGSAVATRDILTPDNLYSDLNFFFKPSPLYTSQGLSGDVLRVYDGDYIRQSLRTIVLTNPFERPFNSNFGAGLRRFLFEQMDPISNFQIRSALQDQIEFYEPRVTVNDIDINQDVSEGRMDIEISYQNKSITSSTVDGSTFGCLSNRVSIK